MSDVDGKWESTNGNNEYGYGNRPAGPPCMPSWARYMTLVHGWCTQGGGTGSHGRVWYAPSRHHRARLPVITRPHRARLPVIVRPCSSWSVRARHGPSVLVMVSP